MRQLILALIISGGLSAQVGINTTTPTETLDVNGKIRVRNVPEGLTTDSLLVIRNGVIRKIPLTAIFPQQPNSNNTNCPTFIKGLSSGYYLRFSSPNPIPDADQNRTINGLNFVPAGNWVQGVYYASWTNTTGTALNINNNFSVNFGSSTCSYH